MQQIINVTLKGSNDIRSVIIDNDILNFLTFELLDRKDVYLLDRVVDNVAILLTDLQANRVADIVNYIHYFKTIDSTISVDPLKWDDRFI